jgi:hypothetical protein
MCGRACCVLSPLLSQADDIVTGVGSEIIFFATSVLSRKQFLSHALLFDVDAR